MTPYYEDELVTLYHGNSREVLRDLGMFGLVVADPPYAFSGARSEWKITADVAIALAEAAHHVKKSGAMAVMTAASGRGIDFALGAVGATLPMNRLLVWHKTFVHSAVAGPWRWDIVPIFIYGKGSFGRPVGSSCYTSGGHDAGDTNHPAELPVGLGLWLISPFEGPVLDPFAGSGSFLVAAKQCGLTAVGIEVDERHCELAATRLQQTTLGLPVETTHSTAIPLELPA